MHARGAARARGRGLRRARRSVAQILVSHANAEDLGIVLGFWTYMSEALQVKIHEPLEATEPSKRQWFGAYFKSLPR